MAVSGIKIDIGSPVLTAKLKAISKHTEALADELDVIDERACPACGEMMEHQSMYADEVLKFEHFACPECEYSKTKEHV